jgi:acyl-CoA synthetase (AMP-forming)/AMP-acid ligase II
MNHLDNNKITTLVELLSYRANIQPQQTAYTFLMDGETEVVSISYQGLEEQAKAIATYLQSCFAPGDRVLLLYQPGLDYISAFFGCLYAGIVAVPAYPPRPNRSILRIESIIANAQAKAALSTRPILNTLENRITHIPQLQDFHWIATDEISLDLANQWRSPVLEADSLAFLQYTSGSTSTPKGVMITHNNLLFNSHLIHQNFEHGPNSSVVSWLPMYHDMGLIGGILQPLYGGFPATLMSPLMFLQSPIRWLKAIDRYRATSSGGPNFAYELCLRKINPEQLEGLDLSSWDVAFNGAEPISHQTIERFTSTFAPYGFRQEAFYPCYGMAEATLMIAGGRKADPVVTKTLQAPALEQNQVVQASPEEENVRTVVGCGRNLTEQKIIVVNPETLKQCRAGQVGEIWVTGPSVARGYWGLPVETNKTFHAYLADTAEGPFLRTGDLGFQSGGELFVTGRLKDLIIINGRNYYPQDIEWTIEQHHPQIRPSCSAGFSVNISGEEKLIIVAELDRSYQKSRCAVIKGNGNGHGNGRSHLDPNELIRSIRRTVSRHHDLEVYATLLLKPGSIPKTSSGKIQRYACRYGFLSGTLQVIDNN